MPLPDLITLHHGATHLQVCPAAGGSIVRFWHDDGHKVQDWLRPVSQQAISQQQGRDMGCYPLVPYCNRIRAGRFNFQDLEIKLPLNAAPQKHSLHGHGWQTAWQVVSVNERCVTLNYQHAADAWPWDYQAQQTFALSRQTLRVDLQIENLSDCAMPVGLGVHPFFIRTPQTQVYAQVDQIWLTDPEIMPTELVTAEPERDPKQGIWVDQVALDNNYTHWGGLARIKWPECGAEMTLCADSPFDNLVIFAPTNQSIVCVEPVSQVTDAVNLAERSDTGLHSLEPGLMFSASASFYYAFIGENAR